MGRVSCNRSNRLGTALVIVTMSALLAVVGSAAAFHGGTFTKDGDIGPTTVEGATQVLAPPDDDTKHFGKAVDANGGTSSGTSLAVAAPGVDRVYIYKWLDDPHEWQHSETIYEDVRFDRQAISFDEDWLAIAGPNSISMYYRDGGWTLEDTLSPDSATVEVKDSWLAASNSTKDYIYVRPTGLNWEEKTSASGEAGPVAFGSYSDGRDLAVFGRFQADEIHVWRHDLSGWNHVQTLEDGDCGVSEPDCGSGFGKSVDLSPTSEHKLIGGAPLSNEAQTFLDTGSDPPFAHEATLVPDDDGVSEHGRSVNAYDGRSIVGDRTWETTVDGETVDGGAVFRYEAGQDTGKLTADPPESRDHFGDSIHFAQLYALVGAPNRDLSGISGEGYVGYFD